SPPLEAERQCGKSGSGSDQNPGAGHFVRKGAAMQDFVYQSAPMRVVFGTGTLRQLPDELSRLGVTRPLVLATPRQNDLVAGIREMIGERFAGVFTGAVMHTPVEVTERAMETVRDVRADCLVAIGGGS